MTIAIDHKALFDQIRRIKGAPLDAADVAAINRVLAGADPAPPAGYDGTALEAEMIRDEGLITGRSYRCTANKLTVGIGRNLDANPLTADEEQALGITNAQARAHGVDRAQALILFRNDVAKCIVQLDEFLPWWRTLSDARQRVLINMAFNLGIHGLLGFKNTLKLVEAGHFDGAAANMLRSLWARQVGARANRLAAMMTGGIA